TVDGSAGELAVGQIDAILLRSVAELGQGVVADLVAEAPTARVDHDADHVLFEAHRAGCLLVEDVIDDLDLEEVVARAEGTALLGAACLGMIADGGWLRPVEPPARLGEVNIALHAKAAAQQIARSFAEEVLEFLLVELVASRAADSGRHVAEQLLDQRADVRLDLAIEQIG